MKRTAVILGKYLAMLSIAVCATVAQSKGQAAQQTPSGGEPGSASGQTSTASENPARV